MAGIAWSRIQGMEGAMMATSIGGIEEALRQCGVTETSLASREKEALDRDGYVVLPAIAGPAVLDQLREAFERWVRQEDAAPAGGRRTGTRHADDLAGKDPDFDVVFTHPRPLAAVHHVLRRAFKVFQLGGRDPLPGYGQQGLHTDWLPRSPSEPYSLVTAIWLLDDFTPRNGATRVIPASHLLPRPLPKSRDRMTDPAARHPDQRFVVAAAGSVLVLNGHLWHSGTRNKSDLPRRVLQCQLVARELARPAEARPDALERLAPAARYLLGF